MTAQPASNPDGVALVTGGASGIGEAVAKALLDGGWRVAVLDRNPDAARLGEYGDRVAANRCDVTDAPGVADVVARVEHEVGPIRLAVNSAGLTRLAPAEELLPQDFDVTVRTNLHGTYFVCREVGRHMLRRSAGRIVNIASQAGSVAIAEHAAYCASKFGIIGLTKVLALEWGPHGITVNAVSPTVVLTDLSRAFWAGDKGERMKQEIPTRRFAEPEEIAAAVLYLASDAAAMVNGHDLVIDGGYTSH